MPQVTTKVGRLALKQMFVVSPHFPCCHPERGSNDPPQRRVRASRRAPTIFPLPCSVKAFSRKQSALLMACRSKQNQRFFELEDIDNAGINNRFLICDWLGCGPAAPYPPKV